MAATRVGLVYSTTTWRLRAVVVPDDDAQLSDARFLGLGEAMWSISAATYTGKDTAALQLVLNVLTGHAPSGDRYANVDSGNNVVSVHIADPVGCGDPAPSVGATLIPHATAQPGDLLWGGKLIRPPTFSRAVASRGARHVPSAPGSRRQGKRPAGNTIP